MTPQKVTFYVYAETEQDTIELQKAMNDFVRAQYNKGVLVTANKLTDVLTRFGNSFLVTNYLKN
jgi:selenophosphate synthase